MSSHKQKSDAKFIKEVKLNSIIFIYRLFRLQCMIVWRRKAPNPDRLDSFLSSQPTYSLPATNPTNHPNHPNNLTQPSPLIPFQRD